MFFLKNRTENDIFGIKKIDINFELKLDRILCIFIEMFMYLVSGAQRAPTSGYITSCDERDYYFFFGAKYV